MHIATAPLDTYYKTVFEELRDTLAKEQAITLRNIPTQGSVENIELLNKSKVDLALVQTDIAFLAENGLPPFTSNDGGFSTIVPLYPEPIYLITNKQDIYTLDQLTYKKVNVGFHGSGLLESVKVILKSSNKWKNIKKYYTNNSPALEKLANNELDAMFLNELSENTQKLIDDKKLFVVSLDDAFVEQLQKTYPHFLKYSDKRANTVAITTLLVCNSNLSDKLVYDIAKAVYENPPGNKAKSFMVSKEFNQYLQLSNLHQGSNQYFESVKVKSAFSLSLLMLSSFILLMIILTSWFVYNVFIVKYSFKSTVLMTKDLFIRKFHILIRFIKQNKYYIVFAVYILTILVFIILIKYFEHMWAIQHNIISPLDSKGISEILKWFFIFSLTYNDGNYFPLSNEAQILFSLLPLANAAAALAFIGLLTTDKFKQILHGVKGMKVKKYSDHTVIFGWNEKVPSLIKELTHESLVQKNEILILDNVEKNHEKLLGYNASNSLITYIKGDALQRSDLELANINESNMIVVVSEDTLDADAMTIMKVLTISKSIAANKRQHANIIAEIKDTQKIQLAYDAGATQVISLVDIESKIFTQTIRNPGVARFIDEIFTVNDENDIYAYKVDAKSDLIGKTYDDALVLLRSKNILLLAINIEAQRTDDEIQEHMKNNGLSRLVITNPYNNAEKKYKISRGDILILLAQYEKDIYNL